MAVSPHLPRRPLSPRLRHRLRFAVPGAAVVATVVATALPQTASGSEHPSLPARTAAQLLAAVEQAKLPSFTGTTVETARLGLPSLPGRAFAGPAGGTGSQLQQLVTLLTGSHTARLAYAGPDQQRAAIFLDDLSETDIVHNGKDLWTYSSDGNTVTHRVLTDEPGSAKDSGGEVPLDPTKAAEQALAKIDPSTAVTVDPTARVAGRPAYQLVLSPRDPRSLIGSVRIALDAATSMPLRVQIWPRSAGSKPAFEVGFTSLTLRTPSPSTFAFSVPHGAIVNPGGTSGAGGNATHLLGRKLADHGSGATTGRSATEASRDATAQIGKDWLTVLTGPLPQDSGPTVGPAGNAADGIRRDGPSNDASRVLDQIARPVSGGRVINTALVSVFITDAGRYYVGAVDPAYLEQVAEQAHA